MERLFENLEITNIEKPSPHKGGLQHPLEPTAAKAVLAHVGLWYVLDVLDILQTEDAFTVEEYKHTHIHTTAIKGF